MSIIVNRKIIFLDSLQFLKTSLDSLASNLEDADRKYLLSEFPTERQELLKNKEPYPYEQIDDNRKSNYPRLPPKDAFYSRLNSNKRHKGNGHITNSQYNNLKNAWNIFNFKTFKDFHIHFLKKDVLLLADVFEKFISTCLRFY